MKKIFYIIIIIMLGLNIFQYKNNISVESQKPKTITKIIYKDRIVYKNKTIYKNGVKPQTDYEKLTIQNWIKIDIEIQKFMPSCYNSQIGHKNYLINNIQINEIDFLKAFSKNLSNSFDEYGDFKYKNQQLIKE
jgi:hypothetical protein